MRTTFMQQIDLIMGGPGPEADISRASARHIAPILTDLGHDVQMIDIERDLDFSRLRPNSVVFNIIHGRYGEDGTLQEALEAVERTFIGSGSAASRLCMDKAATKQVLEAAGLPVPAGVAVAADDPGTGRADALAATDGLIVKPAGEGSSFGLRLIDGPAQVAAAIADARSEVGPVTMLVEARLRGPEYSVTVLEGGEGQLTALTPVTISVADTYDFAAKYQRDDTGFTFVDVPDLVAALGDLARRACVACGCRDLARVDIMADRDGSLYILEINTLPGFTDHSLVPMAAAHDGLGLPFLLEHMVLRAADRRVCRCKYHPDEGVEHA